VWHLLLSTPGRRAFTSVLRARGRARPTRHRGCPRRVAARRSAMWRIAPKCAHGTPCETGDARRPMQSSNLARGSRLATGSPRSTCRKPSPRRMPRLFKNDLAARAAPRGWRRGAGQDEQGRGGAALDFTGLVCASGLADRRIGQEGVHGMPEAVSIDAEPAGVHDAGQHDELFVFVG
jgi:hypothetical protein